jgi:hypothetical protein
MLRYFITFLVFVAVIGTSATMVSRMFKSKYNKDVFIVENSAHHPNPGCDSTTGNPRSGPLK